MKHLPERLGPTKLFIKYILNNHSHCTEGFEVKDLARQVKQLKSLGVTNLTIHYTNNPPPNHTT